MERREGPDVPAEEALECLLEREAGVDGAAPGEDEDEAGQRPLGVPDRHLPEVAPVDLALLAGERLQPEIGLGARRGPDSLLVSASPDNPRLRSIS